MKKTMRFFPVPIIMVCLILFALPNVFAKTVLKMNHQFPSTTAGSKIDQWFADKIKERTKGDVVIKIFWSNGLGGPKENLMLLKMGAIDMAAMSSGYFPSELAFFSAPNAIPMGMDNICQSSAIMKAFMDKITAFSDEARINKIKPLFFHLLNPYLLVTKKPVRSFSDLKGMRIRTWGKDMPRLIKAAGGNPVPLFLPDIYEALKRSVIDGCPFSVDLMVSYKIYEQAKHVTEVVLWEGPGWGVWISEKTWQVLSPENQAIFIETAEEARQLEIPATHLAEKEARVLLKKKGVTFHLFPQKELAKWQSANPDFFEDLINRLSKTGQADDAKKTVDLWLNMRKRIKCSDLN